MMVDVDANLPAPALPTVLPQTPLSALLTVDPLGRIIDSNLGAIVSLIDRDTRQQRCAES